MPSTPGVGDSIAHMEHDLSYAYKNDLDSAFEKITIPHCPSPTPVQS